MASREASLSATPMQADDRAREGRAAGVGRPRAGVAPRGGSSIEPESIDERHHARVGAVLDQREVHRLALGKPAPVEH